MTLVPHLETALTGPLLQLEEKFLNEQVKIESWFRQQWQETPPPFYGSVDLRNAGFKLAPVDTNLFPAGFNNLNAEMITLCVQAVQSWMAEKCPNATRLLLIPESHTRNIFYFENIAILTEILERAGFEVRLASLIPDLEEPLIQTLPSGREIILEPLIREENRVGVKNYFPCCIILNNDFSSGVPDILQNTKQLFMPSLELGWATRLKSDHFRYYQSVAESFAQAIQIDPWLINPYFDHCGEVDFSSEDSRRCLAKRADGIFAKIRQKYAEYQIDQTPFVVVKADQGTYGMAVMMIQDPEELVNLNRKQRTKMSSLKGGHAVTKVILQEGVHTFETLDENAVAEPVVYHIGRHVVGGFYRVHKNRGINENLNAPGMDFVTLAFAKHCYAPSCKSKQEERVNRFYAYGVVSRLAMVAAAREVKSING